MQPPGLDGSRERGAVFDDREMESISALAIAASLDAIIIFDEKGITVELNPAAESMFGHDRAEAVGHATLDLIVPEHLRGGDDGIAAFIARAESVVVGRRIETEARTRDGRILPVELT